MSRTPGQLLGSFAKMHIDKIVKMNIPPTMQGYVIRQDKFRYIQNAALQIIMNNAAP
jgi:hypothetical protein